MTINYKDGSQLHCTVISFCWPDLIADEMWAIPIDDIADITDDDETGI